jgi:protein-tyrosine phosphatase
MTTARHLTIDGCYNVRDVGGYIGFDGRTTVWGRLYRADGPNYLSETGRAQIAELGLATVIDLRAAGEHGEHPFVPGAISLPMFDAPAGDWSPEVMRTPADLADRYYEMATEGRVAIRQSFELFAERLDRPALVHCAAGKDRTGIVLALVLSVCGVSEADIAADYHISHTLTDERRAWLIRTDPEAAERYREFAPIVLTALPETMAAFLALLDRHHGSAAGFLDDIRVGLPIRQAVCAHLLE